MAKYLTKTLRLPDGKRKYIRAHTKEELEEKYEKAKAELRQGIDISNDVKFKDYAQLWFDLTKKPYVQQQTAYQIEHRLAKHILPYIGHLPVREIRATHIHQVMAAASGLKRGTQSAILQTLRSIFDMALDDNVILRSPVPKKLKARGEEAEDVTALTPEQERELLDAAKQTRLYPAVYIILHTGLRRGELLGLMWSDVDYTERVIRVRRHVVAALDGSAVLLPGAKTKAGVRDIPMPDCLISYLRSLQSTSRSVYVFPNTKGQPHSPAAFYEAWAIMVKRLSFSVHPHMLRHTYITHLFESGLDLKQIQYVAGHENSEITEKVYTHFRKEARFAKTMEQIQAAFG